MTLCSGLECEHLVVVHKSPPNSELSERAMGHDECYYPHVPARSSHA